LTLILNGTDNSATTPAVTGTDTDTGVYYPAANQVALATNGTQALLVDSSQNVAFTGQVTSTGVTIKTAANTGLIFNDTVADRWQFVNRNDASDVLQIVSGNINSGGSSIANLTSEGFAFGNIGLGFTTPTTSGTGITFPATQSASSNANTLDDYEEGTWTPTWSGGVTGVTYGSVQAGYYRKIGSQVTIWFGVMTNGLTVTSSGLSLSGLPFTSASGSGSNGTVNVWNVTRWVSSPPVVGYVNLSSTSIIFYNSINATGAGVDPVEVTTGNMSTGSGNRNLVFGSATYSV
jgi:hypothetical protein